MNRASLPPFTSARSVGDKAMQRAPIFRVALIALVLSFFVVAPATRGADGPPAWAYPVTPPGFKLPPNDGHIAHMPGSSARYSVGQLRDFFLAMDWYPTDHPPMPDIVAFGRKPEVFACGHCHRADGSGGPENASLAGLPAPYIVQQMVDFKTGARKSSVPKRIPITLMLSVAHAVSADEVAKAAAYFSDLTPKKRIKVTETSTAPKTYVDGLFYAASKDGGQEPIGDRIVEVPDDLDQYEAFDAHAEITAYVPVGSVARGQALVTTGGAGKTVQCGICHGSDLRGLGPIPSIAGRSPSYIVRQLYDFQHGARTGEWSPLMARVVADLTDEDLVSIAAYLASRDP
jgi:cytochrome c553